MKPAREDLKHLKAIVERNREERNRYEQLKKTLEERSNEVRSAPDIAPNMGFFCVQCDRDCGGPGFKEIRLRANDLWFAFYRGFCPAGHRVMRRITDKLGDPYFYRSRVIVRQQASHADDFLTPNDPRFKEVYPTQWADLKEREAWEVTNPKKEPELEE